MKKIILSVVFLSLSLSKVVGQTDGPYVFYKNAVHEIKSVADGKVNTMLGEKSFKVTFDHVNTNFEVVLKDNLVNETSIYAEPKKLFVVSDVEGEFESFRELLIRNRIINGSYDWTFGKGHLVITGDLFDRGTHVTEFLWLLYSLEEKAKAAGGYVHVILGNHDIMNLSGDYRYVDGKYFGTVKAFGVTYAELFNEQTELGRWLRTKNIIEKIGDKLFVHGGISAAVLETGLSVEEINTACRPYYAVSKGLVPANMAVFFGKDAPFWYRGYFMQPRADMVLIDITLIHFSVKQIIVGHTILARNIAMYYGGKVIGVDVDYHAGHSGGLFYERGKWLVCDAAGKNTELVYKPENDVIKDEDIL